MAIRFYLVPKAGTGTKADPFRPQYIAGVIAGEWQSLDYGKEAWMVVAANVTAGEHTTIAANADVTAVPANLDTTVGAALSITQTKLELANIPADWVTSGMTWRTVLKWTIRMLLLMQRFDGLDGLAARFFASGLTLDSTVNDLPAGARTRLDDAAANWGLDTSSITLSTPIRTALRVLGQQMTFSVTVGQEVV
jgi:hypothetical protein